MAAPPLFLQGMAQGDASEPRKPPHSSAAVTRGARSGDDGPGGTSAGRSPRRSKQPEARAAASHVRTVVMVPSGGDARRVRLGQLWAVAIGLVAAVTAKDTRPSVYI